MAIGDENITRLLSRVASSQSTTGMLSSPILPSTFRIGMPFYRIEVPASVFACQFSASKAESFSER